MLSPVAATQLRRILARRHEQSADPTASNPDENARRWTVRLLGEDLAGPALLAFRLVFENGGAASQAIAAAAPYLAMNPDFASAWNAQLALEQEAIRHFQGYPPFRLVMGAPSEWWQILDFHESDPDDARAKVALQARTILGLSSADAAAAANRVWQTLRYGLGAGGPSAAAPGGGMSPIGGPRRPTTGPSGMLPGGLIVPPGYVPPLPAWMDPAYWLSWVFYGPPPAGFF